MALPSISPFASCPSCGGWARRPLAPRETRAHCRGCGWRGVLPPGLPPSSMATPRAGRAPLPPAPRATPPRLEGAFPPPGLPSWRPWRSES